MTGAAQARDFLQSVTGFGEDRSTTTPEETRPLRLGTIDPAYTSGLPRITFDGETILSGRGYPWASPYRPVANDRVVLAPVGRSYLILGGIATALPAAGVPTPVAAADPVPKSYADGAYIRRTRSTDLSVPNATFTEVNWLVDSGESFGATPIGYSNPAFTIPFAAIVEVHVQVTYTANATGRRLIRMLKNGTETYRGVETTSVAGWQTTPTLHGLVRVAAGDTLSFETYQTSGAALAIVGNPIITYAMLRAQRIA
jgi:hypothetical protein